MILTENLTAQRIFDHVAVQLALQGAPSMIGVSCAYRGAGGTKCGVGFLLDDDEVGGCNRISVGRMCQSALLPERLVPYLALLMDLQDAHDVASVQSLFRNRVQIELLRVADRYGFEKGVLYAAFPNPNAPEQASAPDVETRKIVASLETMLTEWAQGCNNGVNHDIVGSSA